MNRLMKESQEKLKELQSILMRITSLRNGRGGDIFFRGLAKTFQAEPVIPKSSYYLSANATVFISDGQQLATGAPSPKGEIDSGREKLPRSVRGNKPAEDALEELNQFHKESAAAAKIKKKNDTMTVPERFQVKTKLANAAGGGAFMKKKKN